MVSFIVLFAKKSSVCYTVCMLDSETIAELQYYFLLFIVILIVVPVHEFAHGYIALKNGDPTAKKSGRLTLNPLKHFDLFGLLSFALLGFGFAKPVPVNHLNFRKQRLGWFTVAIAGVTANIIMGFLGSAIYAMIAYFFPDFMVSKFGGIFHTFIGLFMVVNCSLFVFNLIPIYPLDGFRIIESFTKPGNKFVRFMYQYGRQLFLILIFIGFFAERFLPQLEFLNILGFIIGNVSSFIYNGFLKFWVLIFGLFS